LDHHIYPLLKRRSDLTIYLSARTISGDLCVRSPTVPKIGFGDSLAAFRSLWASGHAAMKLAPCAAS
jgi:hypothetical protein